MPSTPSVGEPGLEPGLEPGGEANCADVYSVPSVLLRALEPKSATLIKSSNRKSVTEGSFVLEKDSV